MAGPVCGVKVRCRGVLVSRTLSELLRFRGDIGTQVSPLYEGLIALVEHLKDSRITTQLYKMLI